MTGHPFITVVLPGPVAVHPDMLRRRLRRNGLSGLWRGWRLHHDITGGRAGRTHRCHDLLRLLRDDDLLRLLRYNDRLRGHGRRGWRCAHHVGS